MFKIGVILGTRPEIIKLYSIIKYLEEYSYEYFIIHTNQHYDPLMDSIFFKQLELPFPKYNLGIKSKKHGEMTALMISSIEDILIEEKPDVVLVQGDTNTVLAGALAASKLGIKIAHIEAGLRSYDRSMPEEINRVVVDHISDFLFAPTKKQATILLNEGISRKKIFITGNTIVDAVNLCKDIAEKKSNILKDQNLEKNKFNLLTCHRPSNTDSETNFRAILEAVNKISLDENKICVFQVHPRLRDRLSVIQKYKGIKAIDPVSFLDSIQLQRNCNIVFTDSGGIQEESCILRKKCVILRMNTERQETLKVGGSVLIDNVSVESILTSYNNLKNKKVRWRNPFGDGKAYQKIIKSITKSLIL